METNTNAATRYDRMVAAIERRNAESTTLANGRRMIIRHERGMVSMWEAICGLTMSREPVPSLSDYRAALLGANRVNR